MAEFQLPVVKETEVYICYDIQILNGYFFIYRMVYIAGRNI